MDTAGGMECSKSFMWSCAGMKNGGFTGMGILDIEGGAWCWLHIWTACSDTGMYGCVRERQHGQCYTGLI